MNRLTFVRSGILAGALALCGWIPTAAAVTADAPGWVVSSTDIGGAVQGDIAYAGSAIFAGTGSYGAGTQSIVRIDDSGSTEVVTGLNSLGGIIHDAASDTLYFLDNGYQTGSTTGDTLYGLPGALSATGTAAASLELAPSGSIGTGAQLVMESADSILLTDAGGPGLGGISRYTISSGALAVVASGFDYVAGISVESDGGILLGDVDASSYVGTIETLDSDGTHTGTFATPGGAFDQHLDAAGNLLVTGSFAPDWSSSVLVSLDPDAVSTQIASGFEFSAGLDIDGPSGQIAVTDSCYPTACTEIHRLTPTAGMTGLGRGKKDCNAAFFGGVESKNAKGKGRKRWECTDGEIGCDRDGQVDGTCTFVLGACLGIDDPADPNCTAADVDEVEVKRAPKIADKRAFPALQAAVDAITAEAGATCSETVTIEVPQKKKVVVKLKAKSAGKTVDRDVVKLLCR